MGPARSHCATLLRGGFCVQLPYLYSVCLSSVEAQTQLNVALEKERSTMEKHMTLKSRVGALEAQLSSVKQEKSQLLATVELERAKLETLEESQHRYVQLQVSSAGAHHIRGSLLMKHVWCKNHVTWPWVAEVQAHILNNI